MFQVPAQLQGVCAIPNFISLSLYTVNVLRSDPRPAVPSSWTFSQGALSPANQLRHSNTHLSNLPYVIELAERQFVSWEQSAGSVQTVQMGESVTKSGRTILLPIAPRVRHTSVLCSMWRLDSASRAAGLVWCFQARDQHCTLGQQVLGLPPCWARLASALIVSQASAKLSLASKVRHAQQRSPPPHPPRPVQTVDQLVDWAVSNCKGSGDVVHVLSVQRFEREKEIKQSTNGEALIVEMGHPVSGAGRGRAGRTWAGRD